MDYLVGIVEAHWNKNGTRILKYVVEMDHFGLDEHKVLSASDIELLEYKVQAQADKWEEKWNNQEHKRQIQEDKEAREEEAWLKTRGAFHLLNAIENLLHHALSTKNTIDWKELKRNDKFSLKSPNEPLREKDQNFPPTPDKPKQVFSIFEKLFKSKKQKKIQKYDTEYALMLQQWEAEKSAINLQNIEIERNYQNAILLWKEELNQWEIEKREFLLEQQKFNSKIDQLGELYSNLDKEAVEEYCELVLNNSAYPRGFPKNFEFDYNPENKVLIVDYELLSIKCFPTLKEVKYISNKNELKETHMSEPQLLKMYDEALYKISLRTLYELFEADIANALSVISFNGYVNAINKATGKEENNCIVSIQALKHEFLELELSQVDPKTCFKNLKGVSSSKLSSITPIQPILKMSRGDKRFVDSYDVADSLDSSTNLAAMSWEDFEHLIRELFQKEFQTNGGEVKVTQASRDGGVDAIAFDPDPIRGGKIVIQAKRYTNTVGVSAVRDLYGTVMNEGATKGILVSTADYGSDAYQFALGKPLTLLNGANLLSLLEKHGHRAKIDLKEAKKILYGQ